MAFKPTEPTGISEALRLTGSQTKLAKSLGVTQQSVSLWLRRGYVPLLRAREIEMLYGVARQRLVSPKVRHAMNLNSEGDL